MAKDIRDILNKAVEENRVTLNSLLQAYMNNVWETETICGLAEKLADKLEELDKEWLKEQIINDIYYDIRDKDMKEVFEELCLEHKGYEE